MVDSPYRDVGVLEVLALAFGVAGVADSVDREARRVCRLFLA